MTNECHFCHHFFVTCLLNKKKFDKNWTAPNELIGICAFCLTLQIWCHSQVFLHPVRQNRFIALPPPEHTFEASPTRNKAKHPTDRPTMSEKNISTISFWFSFLRRNGLNVSQMKKMMMTPDERKDELLRLEKTKVLF